MTPRQRVAVALRGGHAGRVPFTMYEYMIPQCTAEREMRNRGLCILNRSTGVFKVRRPNVRTRSERFEQGGKHLVRTVHETPVGALSVIREPAGFTSWTHENMFKSPDDYKAMLFLIQDERYVPAYEEYSRVERELGEDVMCRPFMGLEPLNLFITSDMMKMENFCIEWMERRDEILKLYEAVVANYRRQLYPIMADSPAWFFNYGGNVVAEIVGPENYRKYFVPHYNEAAEVLHRRGKLIGCHMDANCGLLAEAIAETDLDYIEAFTPAPDTDMTLAQARSAWPDKVLWLNFPSSLHLRSDAEVAEATVNLLEEVSSMDGILMGITEDIPRDRWQDSCRSIMDGLEQHAVVRPDRYA